MAKLNFNVVERVETKSLISKLTCWLTYHNRGQTKSQFPLPGLSQKAKLTKLTTHYKTFLCVIVQVKKCDQYICTEY